MVLKETLKMLPLPFQKYKFNPLIMVCYDRGHCYINFSQVQSDSLHIAQSAEYGRTRRDLLVQGIKWGVHGVHI